MVSDLSKHILQLHKKRQSRLAFRMFYSFTFSSLQTRILQFVFASPPFSQKDFLVITVSYIFFVADVDLLAR